MGPIIVLILRLLVPLTIFRWPLWGGIAAIVLDLHDLNLIKWVGADATFSPAINNLFTFQYQGLDKFLDMYYLTFEFIVSLRWQRIAKLTSVWLFIWRLIGFIVFEITKIRIILVLTPNIFENFFLFHLITKRYFPKFTLTRNNLLPTLILLGLPKLYQEYMLHVLDSKPYIEFKEAVFHFLKGK